MGVPTSEVSYTSATARRGDHESSYEHVVALKKIKLHWDSSLQKCEACLTSAAVTSGHQQSLRFPPVWASSQLRRQIGCYRGSSFIRAPSATWRYASRCKVEVVVSAPRSSSTQWSRCLAGIECDKYYCNNDVLMVSKVNALRRLTVAWISKIKRLRTYVSQRLRLFLTRNHSRESLCKDLLSSSTVSLNDSVTK